MRLIATVGLSILLFSQTTEQLSTQPRNPDMRFGPIRVHVQNQSRQLKKKRSKRWSDSDSDSSGEDLQNLSIYSSLDDANDNFRKQTNLHHNSSRTKHSTKVQSADQSISFGQILPRFVGLQENLVDKDYNRSLDPVFLVVTKEKTKQGQESLTSAGSQTLKLQNDQATLKQKQIEQPLPSASEAKSQQSIIQSQEKLNTQQTKLNSPRQQKLQDLPLTQNTIQTKQPQQSVPQTIQSSVQEQNTQSEQIKEVLEQLSQQPTVKRQTLRIEQAKDKIAQKSQEKTQTNRPASSVKAKQAIQKKIEKTQVNVYPCYQSPNIGTINSIYCMFTSLFK